MSDQKVEDEMDCGKRYASFMNINEHLEDSISSIIDNFNKLVEELRKNDNNICCFLLKSSFCRIHHTDPQIEYTPKYFVGFLDIV